MAWLRNVVYLILLGCFVPFLIWKAFRTGKYREGWPQKFMGRVPRRKGERPCAWFHAVSMGEIRVLHRLVPRFAAQYPDWDIVVSTTTLTGRQVALEQFSDYAVIYFPLDFTWAVSEAMRRIRPRVIVLAELEIWPNFIRAAKRAQVPVCVINGRLSERSYRGYRRLLWAVRSTFAGLSYVGVQSETYRRRFVELGATEASVQVTGSLKFDGVSTDRQADEIQSLRQLAKVDANDQVWLAGSTQPEEDDLVLSVFAELAVQFPRLRLILVPRHPERFREAGRKVSGLGMSWQRRSELPVAGDARWRILLVDSVGELSRWWGLADIAYVGGSMGRRGGQNMIEPAAFGAAVCFGPSTANFKDVVQLLLERDGACVVHDVASLGSFVRQHLLDRAGARSMGDRARDLVRDQQGATESTLAGLERVISGQLLTGESVSTIASGENDKRRVA